MELAHKKWSEICVSEEVLPFLGLNQIKLKYIFTYPNLSNAIFSKSSNPCNARTLCNFVFEQILNFCSHSECVTRVSIYAIREAAWSIKFSCATISTWWSDMSDWQDRKWQNIILGLQIACFQNKAS